MPAANSRIMRPEQPRLRRVLMLAYFFPPVGGAGVQRSAKFAKFLPEFGWEPYVIATTRSIGGEEQDPTLLADVRPNAHVWRVPTPQTFILRDLKRAWGGLESALNEGSKPVRIGLRSLLLPLSLAESPPADPYFWWSMRIIPLACRLVAQYHIDVIYTTSPPWSVTLAGRFLKRVTGRPLVVDFRDPWTHNQWFGFYHEGWRPGFDARAEAAALRSADKVITVMPMDDLLEWRSTSTHKARVIYNGFDREDCATGTSDRRNRDGTSAERSRTVRMLHVGTLYPGDYSCFVRALEELPGSKDDGPTLELSFLGDSGYACSTFGQLVNPAVRITFSRRVSHGQAIEMLRSADVLLMLNGWKTTQSKLFEYLASGTPILAIVPPDSPVAGILADTRTGYAADVSDGEALKAALQRITQDCESFRVECFAPDREAIQRFERRDLTLQLASVLDECICLRAGRKADHA